MADISETNMNNPNVKTLDNMAEHSCNSGNKGPAKFEPHPSYFLRTAAVKSLKFAIVHPGA